MGLKSPFGKNNWVNPKAWSMHDPQIIVPGTLYPFSAVVLWVEAWLLLPLLFWSSLVGSWPVASYQRLQHGVDVTCEGPVAVALANEKNPAGSGSCTPH